MIERIPADADQIKRYVINQYGGVGNEPRVAPAPEGMAVYRELLGKADGIMPLNELTWKYWIGFFPAWVNEDSEDADMINEIIAALPFMPREPYRLFTEGNSPINRIYRDTLPLINEMKNEIGIATDVIILPDRTQSPVQLPANVEAPREPGGAGRDTEEAIEENIEKPKREEAEYLARQAELELKKKYLEDEIRMQQEHARAERLKLEKSTEILTTLAKDTMEELNKTSRAILAAAEAAKQTRIERDDKDDLDVRKLAEEVKAADTRADILDPKRIAARQRQLEEETKARIAQAIESIREAGKRGPLSEQDIEDLKNAELGKYDQHIKDRRDAESGKEPEDPLDIPRTLQEAGGLGADLSEKTIQELSKVQSESKVWTIAQLQKQDKILREYQGAEQAKLIETVMKLQAGEQT